MTQTDQQKVINKGFTIIRADYFRKEIKFKSKENLQWKVWDKGFKTKKAMENTMRELLEKSNFIED